MFIVDDVYYYSNLTDFVLGVKNANTIPGRNKESMQDDYNFTKTRNIEEAWDKFEKGDIGDIGKNVIEKLDKLNLRTPKVQQFNDVVGFVPNVPNYLMGVPKTMINREIQIFQNKIINVLINSSVSGGVDAERITEMAVEVLEVILDLERNGYRVNIYKMIGSTSSDGGSVLGFIKLKDDRERINLKKIMFPITHPSMQRRLDFRFRECFGKHDVTHNGYGSQNRWDKEYVTRYFKRMCNGDFLYANLHNYDKNWYRSVQKETTK